jgi:hypothetical protein
MDTQQEILHLRQEMEKLKQIVNYFVYADRYQFERTLQHKGNKLGFYGATPISKPSSTGTTSNMTTVGGTAVTESNGFAGSTGSTFYTIGDIVKHLKLLGLLTK